MTDPTANSSPGPQKPSMNPRTAYNPITLEDVEQKEDVFFRGLDTPLAKISAVLLFAAIFFLGRHLYFMAPLLVVVLLACVLYRLNGRERTIVAIPVTFAAIRLGTTLGEDLTLNAVSSHSAILRMQAAGVTWLPLFLAACLFYTPWKLSYTSRAIFWQAVIYLLAGLLPIEGFFTVSTVLTYGIFFVISFTMIRDFSPPWFASNLPVARPLETSPAHS